MLTKNAQVYRLPAPWDMTAEQLGEALLKRVFQPCGAQDTEHAGFGSHIHRPKDAPNILFAAIAAAAAARETREAARGPFHRWLEQQEGRSGPVGDLAYDVIRDKLFPSHIQTLASAKRYLANRHASREALEALTDAWREFETSR